MREGAREGTLKDLNSALAAGWLGSMTVSGGEFGWGGTSVKG